MKYHTGLPPHFPWLSILFVAVIVTGIPTLCIVAAVLWRSRAPRRHSSHDASQVTRASRLGVLVGELWGWAPPRGAVREASLQERRARDFAPGWAALIAVGAAVPVLAAPAILAIVPRISYGPWRPDPHAGSIELPGGQTSWPSAAATVPLAMVAITALALALAVLSLRAVAAAPPLAAGRAAGRLRA